MKDIDLQRSNQIFVGILKKLRRDGQDKTEHKRAIAPAHISQLYAKVFSVNEPWGLLQKVFFETSLHFDVSRGACFEEIYI